MATAAEQLIQQGLKQGIEQGIERGIQQGIERGIEQGIERGIERGIQQGVEQGVAKGKVESVLLVLESRGVAMTELQRQRVLTCKDVEVLDRWLRFAATAQSADELFAT